MERAQRTIGVDRCDPAGVAGVPGLQHVKRFGPANLAHDDPVGAQAKGRADEVGRGDASGPVQVFGTRAQRDRVN